MCRAIIDIGDCATQPVDEESDAAIRNLLPEQVYLERKEAARVELRMHMTETLSCLPIYVTAGPDERLVQPGQRAELTFQDQRSQVLRRAMETNRLVLCVDAPPAAGSWAILVRPRPPPRPLPSAIAARAAARPPIRGGVRNSGPPTPPSPHLRGFSAAAAAVAG